MKKVTLLRFMSFWPPYFGAGIKVRHMAADFKTVVVEMKLHFWNQNYVGSHYGGSIYSMVDPFYMLMLMENLGREYQVWDKAAHIRFKKPGRGRIHARFTLTDAEIEDVRRTVDETGRMHKHFYVEVRDESDQVVAEVDKTLSVQRKNGAKAAGADSRSTC